MAIVARWPLALVVAAQIGSCAVAPTLVARPAALLLTACDRGSPIGAPAALCVPAGQGARDPADGLVIAAGLVLLGSLIVWAWPLAALVSPDDDEGDDDDVSGDVGVG